MKEKIKPEDREPILQTYRSFWDDVEELVRKKVEPLIGKTYPQREWVIWTDASGKPDADWVTVKITVTRGEFDDDGLKIMGEYTHPYTGKKVETAFNPSR